MRLDWFHSLKESSNEDERAAIIRFWQGLPSDLTLVATDVVCCGLFFRDVYCTDVPDRC